MDENDKQCVSGFSPLLEINALMPDTRSGTGDIINIAYGHDSEWELMIEYLCHDNSIRWIIFKSIVSFRAQDERELFYYWESRNNEAIEPVFGYEIGSSPYLSEINRGFSGQVLIDNRLRHFLIGGMNTVVEVIAFDAPRVSHSKPLPPSGSVT